MADINEYLEGLNYEFTEEEKRLMDIFAECWEYCRSGVECKDCEYAPKGSRRVKMLLCMSYQYAKRIIAAADVAPVRHGRWEIVVGSDGKEHMVCTVCRIQQDLTGVFSYCPNCGANMDKEDT